MSDRQAVFFDEYHLDVKVVWHGYRIASVPVMARGACQTWGTLDDPLNRQCMSAGHFWGASARAHVHSPLLYLENG